MAQPRSRPATLLALGTLGLLPAGAVADPRPIPEPSLAPSCRSYGELRTLLHERFKEHPTSAGLADDGTVMQVFASAGAATWTIVSVSSGGTACILATGKAWQQEALELQGEPA
jgi:hypothetical protein